jgi:hypothetical protein
MEMTDRVAVIIDGIDVDWLHSMDIYDYDICGGVVHVVGDVNICYQRLTSIPVQFGYVSGHFYCSNNKLISLAGCPSEVGEFFSCSFNNLTSFEGGPTEVGGDFICRGNRFKGNPDVSHIKIGGDFVWK